MIVTQSYLVFSKDLQLITRIDFNSDGHGLARGEKLYWHCNFCGDCIAVLNLNGGLMHSFNDKGSRKFCQLHLIYITRGLVYISEFGNHCVSGGLVTSFLSHGYSIALGSDT